MSQYVLNTSGPYKQNDGTAITASSTIIDGGVAKNVSDGENLNRSDWSSVKEDVSAIASPLDIIGAELLSLPNIGTLSQNAYYTSCNYDSAHGLSLGDYIQLSSYGSYRVINIVSTTQAIISLRWLSGFSALTDLESNKFVGTFSRVTPENFTMKKNDATVHGQTNSTLESGAADYGRPKVKFMNSLRTRKVATRIRAGQYNIFTGEFTTAPATSNDYTSMDIDGTNVPDDETKTSSTNYGTKGEFALNAGGRTVETHDYEAKTS